MTTRTASFPAWLPCLVLLTFAIGTDDFVIAGVLRDLSQDLHVSEAMAAQLVTVFSVTYAVSAPLMAVLTSRLPKRTVMIGGMLLFAVVNAGAAVAPSFAVLMVLRVVAAITASMMTPAAFATVATLAAPERVGRAMGTVSAGLTMAVIVGVPVGTWLGGAFGWRATMVYVVGLALLVAAGLAVFMPKLDVAAPVALSQRLSPLASRSVVITLLGTMVGASGGYFAFVYIGPIAHSLSDVDSTGLAGLIAVIGVAGIAGAVLGGRCADSWGPKLSLIIALAVQATATLVLAALGLLWGGKVSIVLVAVFLAGWQVAGWAFNAPLQLRLISVAGAGANEAIALNISALYLGISMAGVVGGLVLSGYGAVGVLLAGTAFGLVAMALFALSFRSDTSGQMATLAKENA